MQQATIQETQVQASQLLQGLELETTAAIDDLLLQASQQFEWSFVSFLACVVLSPLVFKYHISYIFLKFILHLSSYYMLLKVKMCNGTIHTVE